MPSSTDTLVVTDTTFTKTITGAFAGGFVCTIDSLDEGAGHLQMTQTSGSGGYSCMNGAVYYVTYDISGTTLMISFDTGPGYPASATDGPYTRQ